MTTIIVYDRLPEASKEWQDLATTLGLNARVHANIDYPANAPADPHITVIDQSVIECDYVSSLKTLCANSPYQPIVATGTKLTLDEAVELMACGVARVFTKPLDRPRTLRALPQLVERAKLVAEEIQEFRKLNQLFATLTNREQDVLQNILVGTSNKDTASLLNVSIRTIESRRAKVYRKLEAGCLAELVRKIDRIEHLRRRYGQGGQNQEARGKSPDFQPDDGHWNVRSSTHDCLLNRHTALSKALSGHSS